MHYFALAYDLRLLWRALRVDGTLENCPLPLSTVLFSRKNYKCYVISNFCLFGFGFKTIFLGLTRQFTPSRMAVNTISSLKLRLRELCQLIR